ncbi:MAG TPA: dihydrolipoamide acetyltransferase family protein [Solirubrobacteraceae bacterium]|nr:dihydrolipoamide acetyltransferase family protein [Solirubrobacteraceae bacterium]
MAIEIVMPRLSDSMEEGTILQWLVEEGDVVTEGEPLVEVETDKASVTYESEHDGTILTIRVQTGESAAVGAAIAVIGRAGEASEAGEASQAAAATAGPESLAAAGAASASAAATSASAPARAPAPAPAGAGATAPRVSTRVKASPLARRIAAQLGVDLATLTGSGPQGRVIRADVERSVQEGAAGARAGAGTGNGDGGGGGRAQSPTAGLPPAPSPRDGAKGDAHREPLTRLQQTVARRMAESRATVPDFELRAEVDMTEVVALREQVRGLTDRPPSINDFIVKAAAMTLREFPRVNGSYRDGAFESYARVNVGIAVAAEDALLVPTIFDADTKSLAAIAETARALAARVRDGSISPAELSGSTFSISNLGMFGVDSFSAVVNPPQAAILAVGSLKQRPVVDTSDPACPAIVARPTVNLTLACDHRILYGADGARFLARVRELLEQPLVLLVG